MPAPTTSSKSQFKNYKMHVIANTHWDREWMKSFQEHRSMLVEYLEQLMDLFDKDKEFKYFHLDSQTIPLEDFAAIRPEKVERLKKYIKSGKLLIGPWYSLPEMNVLDGESIVRNLVMGDRVAKKWGPVMKVGYTPTSNGQVSQLPQIYRGFGIDTMLFYRGVNADIARKEFWWKGADGTTALVEQFPDGRVVFWGIGMLPIVYDMWPFEGETWKYRWNKHGLPFRMNEEREFSLVEPPNLYDSSRVEKALAETKKWETKYNTVRHLLYLDGMDQTPANKYMTRLIRDANKLGTSDTYEMNSLPQVMALLKKEVKNLQTLSGELRTTNKSGRPGFCYLHPGILAARIYLKQENRTSEYKLFKWAEPMASAAWLLGKEYPTPFIDTALKLLFQNHAHDDICGCSVDKVHSDMLYRNSEVNTIADDITRRSLRHIVRNIDTSENQPDDMFVTVFNSMPYARSETVRTVIDMPQESTATSVALKDANGVVRPFHVVSEKETSISVPHDGHTRQFPVRRLTGYLHTSTPATGFEVLQVVEQKAKDARKKIAASSTLLENETLRVAINSNGSFDLTHKPSKRIFRDQHYFSDIGDNGNAWIIKYMKGDAAVTTLKSKATCKLLVNNPDIAQVEIRVTMKLPKGLSAGGDKRSDKTVSTTITSVITLAAGSPRVDIATSFVNESEHHRFRAMFPSDITTGVSYGEMPFDVTKRNIALPADADKWVDRPSPNFPHVNFMVVQDGRFGLSVINHGMPDYEVVDDKRRTVALTLIRGFAQGDLLAKEKWGEKGAQCIGMHSCRYSVMPFAGTWDSAGVAEQAYSHNVALHVVQHGCSAKGALPKRTSFVSIDPTVLVMSALKRSEDGSSLVLRLFNPTDRAVSGSATFFRPIANARKLTLNEELVETLKPTRNEVKIKVKAKEIYTLAVKLAD